LRCGLWSKTRQELRHDVTMSAEFACFALQGLVLGIVDESEMLSGTVRKLEREFPAGRVKAGHAVAPNADLVVSGGDEAGRSVRSKVDCIVGLSRSGTPLAHEFFRECGISEHAEAREAEEDY